VHRVRPRSRMFFPIPTRYSLHAHMTRLSIIMVDETFLFRILDVQTLRSLCPAHQILNDDRVVADTSLSNDAYRYLTRGHNPTRAVEPPKNTVSSRTDVVWRAVLDRSCHTRGSNMNTNCRTSFQERHGAHASKMQLV
jgi:hypothetical protein